MARGHHGTCGSMTGPSGSRPYLLSALHAAVSSSPRRLLTARRSWMKSWYTPTSGTGRIHTALAPHQRLDRTRKCSVATLLPISDPSRKELPAALLTPATENRGCADTVHSGILEPEALRWCREVQCCGTSLRG